MLRACFAVQMPPATVTAPLARFVSGLIATGQAEVMRGVDLAEDLPQALPLLEEAFENEAAALAGPVEPPLVFHPGAALEGARYLYQICLALSDRSLEDAWVRALALQAPPPPAQPGEALALDLTLRHLPEVYALARSISPQDPLVACLQEVAAHHPLSSVGVPLAGPPPSLGALWEHPGLRQLYVDRVVERQDHARLADPAVCQAVREVLGAHAHLAPKLASHIALMPAV